MPRGCDHAIHVHFDTKEIVSSIEHSGKPVQNVRPRHFIVEYNADGDVLRIKERKPLLPPSIGVYDASYWKAGTHPLGTGDTLPKRILAAARAKAERENQARNVTP